MEQLDGRVAVVTGAGSGIGRALAMRFADAGMAVVLADVEERALADAVADVEKVGAAAIGVRTDVSDAAEVEALADAANAAFGSVHVVCNNAGVGGTGPAWELTLSDWEWVLGVNFWGVVHGIRSFVPRLVAQGEGHVVNTASMFGLLCGPGSAHYNASKHAVVAITETLAFEVAPAGVGVTVVCPGYVDTNIADAERNRPAELARDDAPVDPAMAELLAGYAQILALGQRPEDLAGQVLDAIHSNDLYVLPGDEWRSLVRERFEVILGQRAPSAPVLPAPGG